tara:strand:+ start:83 stop:277 length:195 start_codon:yes stop_codon:yes gene_type:complete
MGDVTCTFCADDIVHHFGCSETKAQEFLNTYKKQIAEAMSREGWEAIEDLGAEYGLLLTITNGD